MADFGSMTQGFVIMVVFVTLGLFFSFAGGWMIDAQHDAYTKQGLFDVPPQWDSSGQVNQLINIFYFLMYGLPIAGVGIFLFTIIRKQQYDEYDQSADYGGF